MVFWILLEGVFHVFWGRGVRTRPRVGILRSLWTKPSVALWFFEQRSSAMLPDSLLRSISVGSIGLFAQPQNSTVFAHRPKSRADAAKFTVYSDSTLVSSSPKSEVDGLESQQLCRNDDSGQDCRVRKRDLSRIQACYPYGSIRGRAVAAPLTRLFFQLKFYSASEHR